MLKISKNRPYESTQRATSPAAPITAEGKPLVADYSTGVLTVKEATGAAGEIFVGVSLSEAIRATTATKTDEVTIPNGSTDAIVLSMDASRIHNATATARNAVTGAIVAGTATAGAWTPGAAPVGDLAVKITYVYDLTVMEAQWIQGVGPIGGVTSGNMLDSVGVIENGDVYTDQFDTTVDWTSTGAIKLGADGVFTKGGSGATVTGAYVVELPSAGSPFLGIHFSV